MSVDALWGLFGLAGLPLLWWLHRSARPSGDRPLTAWFLLPGTRAPGAGRARVRAPLLLGLRLAAVVALSLGAAGLMLGGSGGTLVLAAGPFEVDRSWTEPLTIVRAGTPPSLAEGPGLAPVAAPPDWGGALVLGRRHAPRARLVQLPEPSRGPITAGGAARDGDRVIVSATAEAAPTLHAGETQWGLEARNGDYALRAELPAGPAELRLGEARYPLCLPDPAPIKVADAGWPPAVDAMLRVTPGLLRVPLSEAEWRPEAAPATPSGPWAPFAPRRAYFEFLEGPRSAAPVWFAGDLPPPGAFVRGWRALPDAGEVLLHAGDSALVDLRNTAAGRQWRFGFRPEASDLPDTAGWPVLFQSLREADARARARCRDWPAGRPMPVAAEAEVVLVDPAGARRTLSPRGGQVLLDGLDRAGAWRLDSAGARAWIAVQPALEAGRARSSARIAPRRQSPDRGPVLRGGVVLLLAAFALSLGWRRPSAWLLLVAAGLLLWAPRLPLGPPAELALAVDTSGSMPADTAAQADALGVPERLRVEGDDSVRRAGARGQALDGGETRHGPLLGAAAELAGSGAVLLFSDGRSRDGPVPATRPVYTLAPRHAGPDAVVLEARAVRLGEQIFIRARVRADAAGAARVDLGEATLALDLRADQPRAVQAVMPAGPLEVEVRVSMEGDRAPANDARPVAVDNAEQPIAVVLGGGESWAKAAGLRPLPLPVTALAESGARLAAARAVIARDLPAAALPAALVPRLRRWIEAGGVLLLAGRERAYGPGGWAGTELGQLSPLASDPRPPEAEGLALALLLDRSGSMAEEAGGIGAAGAAKVAAALAAGLGPRDHLAVIAFGVEPTVLLPLTPAGTLREMPVPALTRGGTKLQPAMQKALALLERAPVSRRAILVLSDGRFVDDARALEPRLRAAATTVMGVLVGEARGEALARLAKLTGGQVVTATATDAPRVAAAQGLAAGAGLLAEGGAVAPGAAWNARVGGAPPPVGARVRTAARAGARVLAWQGGEPLLAEWGVGEGRVIALASETWALGSEQWAALLSVAAAPRPGGPRLRVEGQWLVYEGEASDPPPPGAALIIDPEGLRFETPWQPRGPGRAIARLPPGPPAVLTVESASARGAVITRLTRPPPPEVLHTGVDEAALALQAALTGGRLLKSSGALPQLRAALPRAGLDTAPWLALLALLLALLDTWRWARPR